MNAARSCLLLAALTAGCATAPAAPATTTPVLLLAFDDGRPDGSIAFPSEHHEGVVRFELPPGQHRLQRLWVAASAPGALRWALYEQTPLEGPGDLIREGRLSIVPGTASNGHDARWATVDLTGVPPQSGVLWLGLKRTEGEPTIAACHINSGQYFLRNDDPKSPLNLMPVKRTPLVRLEVAP